MSVKHRKFLFRPTGRTRTITPEFGTPYQVAEVELVKQFETHSIDADFSGISEVENHGYFYLYESAFENERDGNHSACLLSRSVAAYDAGDNEIREFTSPECTMGICAPVHRGGPVLHKQHGKPAFAAIPIGDRNGYDY